MIGFLAALTITAQAAIVLLLVLLVLRRRRPAAGERILAATARDALRLAWLVSTIATAGSLYMSEVRHFIPCELCWYQRIAMYPLVLLLGVAAMRGDRAVARYVVPLAGIGAAISAYHVQLEQFPEQETISCSSTVPCTTIWFEALGYMTIPQMAGTAFVLVAILTTIGARHGQGITSEA